jgi:hypothetical protein
LPVGMQFGEFIDQLFHIAMLVPSTLIGAGSSVGRLRKSYFV